ncbi:MAG: EamA family transporter [Lachnospiraceae bacterium]|nr:EamA family transporter [Lachnospiraceae bacterium]
MKQKSQLMKKAAPIFVAAAAILWGVLVVFIKQLSIAGFSAMEIVALRVYGSAIFLLLGLLFVKRKLLRIKIRDSWCFVGTGVFSIVFFSYCYFRNVQVSSVALSSILMYTSPVWVTLLSVACFREKLNRGKIVALLLAIAGCCLVSGITGGLGAVSFQGILLGLGSGIGYGLYSIFGRYALNKGYAPMTVTAYTFTFACVGVLPFVKFSTIIETLNEQPTLWLWAIGMALFTTCLSFTLYTIGLAHMEPSRAAVLATLEPIVTTLVGTVLYKEPLTFSMVAGIVLVLVSSILISCADEVGTEK